MIHPAIHKGAVAVITGAASGIGYAVAQRLLAQGMRVCLVDLPGKHLEEAQQKLAQSGDALAFAADISNLEEVNALEAAVLNRAGPVNVLMNNAAIQPGSTIFGPQEAWDRVLAVNLWGVIHGARVFAGRMIASSQPGLIINTGSKQGITTPPGDPAYNVAKAGVKVFTEALQHELRNTPGCAVSAHLLIPGFVYTGLTRHGRTEKPAAAWTAEQTADFMLSAITAGDFYILCPDNDVDRALDEHRIAWAAGDIIHNRPPLSRWHPDFAEAFTKTLPIRS